MPTFVIKPPKPRNPLVAAAQFRRAGKHGANASAQRQADRQATKREATSLDLSRNARGKPPSG